jgi:hypothetical protein
MKTLLDAIKEADEVQIDACWAILRDIRLGIMRKLKCWSLVFDLDEEKILNEAPKDNEGRILDKSTRHQLHDELIKVSQKN